MTCNHLSEEERDSKIRKILNQFELTHSAHVSIGTPGFFLIYFARTPFQAVVVIYFDYQEHG